MYSHVSMTTWFVLHGAICPTPVWSDRQTLKGRKALAAALFLQKGRGVVFNSLVFRRPRKIRSITPHPSWSCTQSFDSINTGRSHFEQYAHLHILLTFGGSFFTDDFLSPLHQLRRALLSLYSIISRPSAEGARDG